MTSPCQKSLYYNILHLHTLQHKQEEAYTSSNGIWMLNTLSPISSINFTIPPSLKQVHVD